jgi:DNA-binding MarR family transcriptional regulator
MSVATQTSRLEGSALGAWRSYLQSHAIIVRELDAELVAQHGLTGRDYEVLLYLAQAENRKLPMSAISERTMLTRSGITRLIDGLVEQRLIDRVSCESDARVSYAQLTDTGYDKLREAGSTHVRGIERLFLTHFSADELEVLAGLLSRLPGAFPGGECTAGESDGGTCTVGESDGGACTVGEEPTGSVCDVA